MRENNLVRRLLEIEVKTCLVSYLHSVFPASVLTKASKENRTVKKKKKKKNIGAPADRCHWNGCYHSYQRFRHVNETNVTFSIVLTHKPRLQTHLNNRSFACRLKCRNSYSGESSVRYG